LGSVVGSGTVEITLVITSTVEGELSNTAVVDSSSFELDATDNQATEATTVLPSADLWVSQAVEPDPVRAGEILTYTIVAHNAGPSGSAAVTLTDVLPVSVVFVSAEPAVYCAQSSPVVCNLPGLPASGVSQVQVVVMTTIDGLITNTVTVAASTYDPDLGNNTSEYVSVVATGADLSVSQVDLPDPVFAGEVLTYTITVHNAGYSEAVNVQLTDTLPADVSLVSVIPDQGNCSPGSVITCALLDMPLGDEVEVTVAVLTSVEGMLQNTVEVASDTEDQDPSDNLDVSTTTVAPAADLWVTQDAEPDPVHVGDALTYTLTVHNAGPSASADMTLTDVLPPSVVFVSAEPAAYCDQASPVVCTLPGLPVHGNSQVQVVVLSTLEGLITNTVTVASATYDGELANNTSVATNVVATTADLSITQEDQPDPVMAEQELTYILNVHNAGPSIAAGVWLTDTLGADVIFVSATPDQGSCISGVEVACDLGNMADGANVEVEVVVIPQTAGSIINTVEVSTRTFEDNLDDNFSTESTTVLPLSADLRLTLADSPDPVMAGGLLTYTAQVANLGPSRAIDPVLTFDLSSEVAFVNSALPCTELGGTVSCAMDEIPALSSVEVTLTVRVSSSTFVPEVTSGAEVASEVADPSLGNNDDEESTAVGQSADLGIDIIDTPDPVGPETFLTYTLVYANYGPSDAAELLITNILPAQVDFIRSSPDICDPGPVPHTVICKPVFDLAAGQTDQVDLVVWVKKGTTLPMEDEVTITALTDDPDNTNNTSLEITSIDDGKPTIEWKYPVEAEGVYIIVLIPGQVITLTVTADDPFGIDRVEFQVWDPYREEYVALGKDYQGVSKMYEITWDFDNPFELVDLPNQVYAYAYDTAGNYSRARIFLIVYKMLLPMIVK
jgi:uncharacterized repeat protein (TIGR01451 family)